MAFPPDRAKALSRLGVARATIRTVAALGTILAVRAFVAGLVARFTFVAGRTRAGTINGRALRSILAVAR